MFEIKYPPPSERVILAALFTSDTDKALFDQDLEEMTQLCRTAGARVVQTLVQKRPHPDASTFIGSGKLLEIKELLEKENSRTLVIDAALSPGQVRNIESLIEAKVIDRGQLILDIFAQHAKTNEAKIQVELAQLNALYPRLTRAWSHFSQQVGGIGTRRGPGEKQLEIDRRLVKDKIHELKQRLKKVEKSRLTQRKARSSMFRISLVGYTNVGKSSLLNALCHADSKVENKLFATLDTMSRRMFMEGLESVIISDTVGFIRKIPHQLVASFQSTLEVVSEADLILIVLDASSPWLNQQLETSYEVMKQLEAENIPRLTVLNKADLLTDPFAKKQLEIAYPGSITVSCLSAEDMNRLKARIASTVQSLGRREDRVIPGSAGYAELPKPPVYNDDADTAKIDGLDDNG
jgi:GTP-binding protein HflX